MNEDKQIPSEYVSIRHIWLKGIEDCRKLISQVANIEASSDDKYYQHAGTRTAVHTIDALYLSLVDHGEALIKTDVEKWKEKNYWPEHKKVWNSEKEVNEKWWDTFHLARRLYEQIIQVLNKYGMLFEEQPRGYSNVIMEEIIGDEENE